ncbi:MAG: RidA family protein [Hyphomicrobiaceae bacterium]|nr:RidA family protein [Hyphomicrobiaceae bacterium]
MLAVIPEQRLAELGLTLPPAPVAVGAYSACVLSISPTGGQLWVSGQLSRRGDGTLVTGRLGADLLLADGVDAAQLSGLNILAQAAAALGDLARIRRTLRLNGFVQATPEFIDHAKVLNGASELLAAVLGDAGIHTRVAVGAYSLPLGAAVEIDAVFEIAG